MKKVYFIKNINKSYFFIKFEKIYKGNKNEIIKKVFIKKAKLHNSVNFDKPL